MPSRLACRGRCSRQRGGVRGGWEPLPSCPRSRASPSQCYRDLALVSRDGMNIVLNKINQILMEKYLKLQDTCRTQVRQAGRESRLRSTAEGREEGSGMMHPAFVRPAGTGGGRARFSGPQALLLLLTSLPLSCSWCGWYGSW